MTEMRAAAFAQNFGSGFAQSVVDVFLNIFTMDHLKETWPTGARVEFIFRTKKMETASGACVNPGFVIVGQLPRVGSFGAFLPQYVERFGCQNFLPLRIRLHDFFTVEYLVRHRLSIRRA